MVRITVRRMVHCYAIHFVGYSLRRHTEIQYFAAGFGRNPDRGGLDLWCVTWRHQRGYRLRSIKIPFLWCVGPSLRARIARAVNRAFLAALWRLTPPIGARYATRSVTLPI